jgi:quercetin dioxygenase-like cupin family protein
VTFLATHTIQKGEITMKNKRMLKLLLAGLLVSCAFSTSMLGRALGTDPVGLTRTVHVGPTAFGAINIHSFTPTHFAEIETLGLSDVLVVDVKIEPGGHTGWHSHPGVVLATVNSGVATAYHADDPSCKPQVFAAGTGFTEELGSVHIVRNEGTTDLEITVVYLIPSGQATRIDEQDPGNCPF